MRQLKCVICGEKFQSEMSFAKYCSEQCRRLARAKDAKEERARAVATCRQSRFDRHIKEADACGLSYGKYTAALRAGKTYEELFSSQLAAPTR